MIQTLGQVPIAGEIFTIRRKRGPLMDAGQSCPSVIQTDLREILIDASVTSDRLPGVVSAAVSAAWMESLARSAPPVHPIFESIGKHIDAETSPAIVEAMDCALRLANSLDRLGQTDVGDYGFDCAEMKDTALDLFFHFWIGTGRIFTRALEGAAAKPLKELPS